MIVFQQNHVEQSDAMIYTTTNLYSHLLKDTHTGSSLTGIEHTRIRTFQFLSIFMRHGSNATHALHNVQHQAFCLQQRLHLAFHYHCYIARLHLSSIIDEDFYLHSRVETTEHFFGNFDTSQNPRLFNQKFGFTHCRSGNTRKGGMISVTYIFCKGEIYQPVNQFFFLIHSFYLFLFDV